MPKCRKQSFYDSGSNYLSNVSHKEVEKMVGMCVNHLKRKVYEIPMFPTNGMRPSKYAKKILKISPTGVRGHGGKDSIYIGLQYYQFRKGSGEYIEYKSFAKDPVIGNIHCRTNFQRLLLVVAHEVAHHVQYKYCPNVPRFKNTYKKGHGDCFKAVYRYLRADLINPMILAENEAYGD